MPFYLSLLLGIVQGLTEFLPISSSGHLQLASLLLGWKETSPVFGLVCHLGTLMATVILLRDDLKEMLKNRMSLLVMGTLPLAFAIFLKRPLEQAFALPWIWGISFCLTALLLFVGERFARLSPVGPKGALVVGFFQLAALLPGLSRSGATISAGRLVGFSPAQAARFSFFLAIPAITGASLLSAIDEWPEGFSHEMWSAYVIGFLASLIVGSVTLRWILRLIDQGKLKIFAWYCLFMGLFCLSGVIGGWLNG
ncbi:MAG: undecaprenyl-diphosphate phosphatase [Verrucomicrobia bacterium]|nr:undecaprenyl-diphosphate phosphatase [Verrucomicrobiota bacterium]